MLCCSNFQLQDQSTFVHVFRIIGIQTGAQIGLCSSPMQLASRVMIVTCAVKEACGVPIVAMCKSFLFYHQLFLYFSASIFYLLSDI